MRSYDLRQWEHSFLAGEAAVASRQYDTAQKCYSKSLVFAEILHDRLKVAAAMDGQARCYAAQKKFSKAAQLYQRSIEICRGCLQENGPLVDLVRENLARELSKLGCLYFKTGQVKEAAEILDESLTLYDSASVSDGTGEVPASRDYALALAAAFHIAADGGDVDKAIKYGEEFLSPTHVVNATTGSADQIRVRYVELLRKSKRGSEAAAIDAGQQYLAEFQQAKDLKRSKDFAAALSHFLKAVDLAKLPSGNGRMLADAYEGAADMYDHLSQTKETRQCLVLALEALGKESVGPTQEKDRLLLKLVRFDLLEPLALLEPEMIRLYEMRRQLYGEQDERTATALVNMVCVYDANGEEEKARKFAEQAWTIFQKAKGISEPINYRLYLGECFTCWGDNTKAEVLYKQGLPELNSVRPESLAVSHFRLALCAQLNGDSKVSKEEHDAAIRFMAQVRSDSTVTRQGVMSLLFLLSDLQRHKQNRAAEILAGYIKELTPNIRSAEERQHLAMINDSLERLSAGRQIQVQRVGGKSRPLKGLEMTH